MAGFDPDAYLAQKKAAPAFDPDAYLAEKSPPPPEDKSYGFKRWAGLEARNLIQGAAAIPATLLDFPAQGINFAADALVGKGKGPRFNEMNQNVAGTLDKLGLPRAETPGERFGSTVAQGVVGAGAGSGLGMAMQGAHAPVAAAAGRTMAQNPGMALTSSLTGSSATAAAAQAGLPWWAQGAAGYAGGFAPAVVPNVVSPRSITPVEQRVLGAGYKMPPATMSDPSILSKFLGGWSGKVKSRQQASAENAGTTNSIAARELGLPGDTTLNDNVFSRVRARAGEAYQAVRQSRPTIAPDDTFRAEARALGQRNSELARDFPELIKNEGVADLSTAFANKPTVSTNAAMDAIQTLRADSTKNLQAIGDPQRSALGHAQRQAATALEDLIERRLSEPEVWHGDQGQVLAVNPSEHAHLVTRFQQARQLIAKSHDVEAATNPATGEVSAAKMAQLAEKRPLSGGLQTIADMGNAIPKFTQSVSQFGGVEPLSVLDLMAAGTTAATTGFASGHPLVGVGAGALALGRPAARALTMSDIYQRALANPSPRVSRSGATALPPLNAALVQALMSQQQQQ